MGWGKEKDDEEKEETAEHSEGSFVKYVEKRSTVKRKVRTEQKKWCSRDKG